MKSLIKKILPDGLILLARRIRQRTNLEKLGKKRGHFPTIYRN
ncbi:hypothetical protein SAMN02746064_01318 [Alkalibacter saccharofermentans DSM 14828]|uniref:Uncharacterized protein n=1 Tax=Alkalibacter saccharofermentans DSM 14828 TaxID=1120975 RepID=A0A1M4WQC3_9FIRM|nr:hypothetical protein SAMN02746064_01318 [Alkalibacter saccharofermentans DSM 14828]